MNFYGNLELIREQLQTLKILFALRFTDAIMAVKDQKLCLYMYMSKTCTFQAYPWSLEVCYCRKIYKEEN